MRKFLISTFWILIVTFLLILVELFLPILGKFSRSPLLFLLFFSVLFLLGILLILLTIKERMGKRLRKFLLLTGASATSFLAFIFLHNIFYGLGMIVKDISFLSYLVEIFHITFFLITVFVCPMGFLIGIVGSIIFFFKKKNDSLDFLEKD